MPREKTFLPSKPEKEDLFIKSKRDRPASTIDRALAGMKPGESRDGFLGKGNILHKPDYVVEHKSEDHPRKKAIEALLLKVIMPNSLSMKSTPEMDKRSLVLKLKKSTLVDLHRLLPSHIQDMTTEELQSIQDLSDEDKAVIQEIYRDISP